MVGGFILAGVLSLLPIVLSHAEQRYAHLTEKGWRMNTYLHGLYDYIKLAETERLAFLQSVKGAERVDINDRAAMVKLYEKLLPYAVLFGLDRTWARELGELAGDNYDPSWYSGHAAFHAGLFAASMQSFSNSMMTTYGAGSSGSSGMSGGSSGGGGGGGGGGR